MRTRTRLTRPSVLRMLLGIGLMLGAGIGMVLLLQMSTRTTSVLVADTVLVPGQVIADEDMRTAQVRLVDASRYASGADQLLGRTLSRVVSEGELIPLDATTASISRMRTVSVQATAPGAVEAGSTVDLWVVESGDEASVARRVVDGAIVASVEQPQPFAGLGDGTSIELVISEDHVAEVLQAASSGAELAILADGKRVP